MNFTVTVVHLLNVRNLLQHCVAFWTVYVCNFVSYSRCRSCYMYCIFRNVPYLGRREFWLWLYCAILFKVYFSYVHKWL